MTGKAGRWMVCLVLALFSLERLSEAREMRFLSAILGNKQEMTATMMQATQASSYEEVVSKLEERLAAKPDPRGFIGLGLVYDENNQPAKTEDAFHKAVAVAPNLAFGYQALGLFYAKQGNFKASEQNFAMAGKISASSAKVMSSLAAEYMEMGDSPHAVDYFKMASDTDTKNLEYKARLAEAYAAEKRFDEAESLLVNLMKENPDYAPAGQMLQIIRQSRESGAEKKP